MFFRFFIFVTLFSGCAGSKINGVSSKQALNADAPKTNAKTSTTTTTKTETIQGTAKLSFSEGSAYSYSGTIVGYTFEKSFTVSNSGPEKASSLAGVALSTPFSFKDGTFPGTGGTCGTTLNASSSCTIVVTFFSNTVQNYSQILKLTFNDGSSSTSVSLTMSATPTAPAPSNFQQKVVATGANARLASNNFGVCTALYQDTLVVGSNGDDLDANGSNAIADAGAVYVYVRSGTTWTLQQKIVGQGTNGRVAGDGFGISVAIYEDTLVVTANGQDSDENGGSSVSDAGALYVFKRSSNVWNFEQKIVASGTNGRMANDVFGAYALEIWKDTIAAGTHMQAYDQAGANAIAGAGAVYVFTRTNNVWSLQQKVVAEGTNARLAAWFGIELDLYEDTLAVSQRLSDYDEAGANYILDSGAVYVYTRSNGVWSIQQKLVSTSTRGVGDWCGWGVAVWEDTLAMGCPGHNFDNTGGNNIDSGAVFVFTRSSNVWTLQDKLVASGTNARVASDKFGAVINLWQHNLVISAQEQDTDEDGNNSVSNAGAVYLFTRSGTTWSQIKKFVATGTNARNASDAFGSSISMGLYSDTVAIPSYVHAYDENGANSVSAAGAVWVFR